MDKKRCSLKYKTELGKGVYNAIAKDRTFRKIIGDNGDDLLVRGCNPHIFLVQRDLESNEETLMIHSPKPYAIKLELEELANISLNDYLVK